MTATNAAVKKGTTIGWAAGSPATITTMAATLTRNRLGPPRSALMVTTLPPNGEGLAIEGGGLVQSVHFAIRGPTLITIQSPTAAMDCSSASAASLGRVDFR